MDKKISIDELNYAINNCRRNTVGIEFISYKFLEYASQAFMKIANHKEEPVFVKYYSHEEALSLVLDFFKSLGVEEWYNRAKEIVFSLNKNIGMSIFNYQDIQDENKEITDKNGIKMYSYESGIASKIDDDDEELIKNTIPKSFVRISKNYRYFGIDYIFHKDKIVIDDVGTIVHEISHSFDISNDMDNIEKRTMIAEITPFCFEKMFEEYLLENKIVDKPIVDSMKTARSQDILFHSRYVFTVLNLYKIQKENDGRITKEGIDEFLRKKDIHDIKFVRECFMDIIDSNYNFDYHVKYMIAGLASSMFHKNYRENRQVALRKLQEYCKCLREGDTSEITLELLGFDQEKETVDEAIDEFVGNYKGSR